MRRHSFYLLFAVVLFLCLNTLVYGSSKVREDKLRYNTMYVDAQNTLWIGSDNGLFRWKSSGSVRISLPLTLNITAILASNENLLLGTVEGTLFLYNTNSKTLKLIADMKAEISDLRVRHSSVVISSKGNGYAFISPYAIRHYTARRGLTDNYVYQTFLDSNNVVWSSTDLGINVQTSVDSVSACSMNRKIPDRLVTCFALVDSILYCGTQRGDICKINRRDSSVTLFDRTRWNSSQVNDMKVLDHMIAIATDDGAFLLDMQGNVIETVVSNTSVKKVVVDMEANIWFCGNRLLVSSSGEQITPIRQLGDLPITNVHSITIDSDHSMYLTPDQGLVKFNIGSKRIQKINFTSPAGLVDITSIFIDHHNMIWVGTSGNGLYQVVAVNLASHKIKIDNSVETSDILTITGDQKTIWVASLNGVWYSDNSRGTYQFSSLEDEYKKKKYYVYDVKKDSKGNLWMATDGQGILKISGRQVSDLMLDAQTKPNLFYCIAEDYAGQMWFNAYTNGLYCLRGDSVIHLSTNNGLISNDIVSIHSFQHKYLVAASAAGIDLINIQTFAVTNFNFESLHLADIPEINSISSDRDNMMYIGTSAGILRFYVPGYKSHFIPQAQIDDVMVMGKCIVKEKSTFNYEENYFKFQIGSNYNAEQMVYYQYKLKGLSEQWNTTVDHDVVFPRLNPGTYEFVLQTANNNRFLDATEAHYTFVIKSPVWKQSWFVFLSLLVFAIGIYYYIRFREARVSKVQKLEKEKAIAEYETLKHQVNPHFLFNSFNTLIQVIDEDKEMAIEYTQMLSDYYRSLLSYASVNLVTLDEEFVLLEKYMYLQKMRFGTSLRLQNDCDASLVNEMEIPPFTLQLLAENAIKHTIISTEKPLTICISISHNRLVVSNNLNEKAQKVAGENIGLQNVRNRFRLFSRQEVEIYKTSLIFEVRLPILKS